MNNQNLLISVESMLDINPLKNFNILFSNLQDHHLDLDYHIGRKPFSRRSLLRALILKNLKGVSTMNKLIYSAVVLFGFFIIAIFLNILGGDHDKRNISATQPLSYAHQFRG